jgi:hypothetical protein
MPAEHPLNSRERALINVLVEMHAELGITSRFTSKAIEHIYGPCTGSLAGLVVHGYARQQSSNDGIVYSLTEKAYALFAGIDAP